MDNIIQLHDEVLRPGHIFIHTELYTMSQQYTIAVLIYSSVFTKIKIYESNYYSEKLMSRTLCSFVI